jgi:hypothetical protein
LSWGSRMVAIYLHTPLSRLLGVMLN